MSHELKKMSDMSQWELYPQWAKVLLFLTSFPFVILARILWQVYPGMVVCALFWLISLVDEPVRWRFIGPKRRACYGLALVGALGNATATLANGGFMPVLALDKPSSLWTPLTSASRVAWLCDIYAGFSLGDFFIIAALCALLVVWAMEKLEIMNRESVADGKRLPGIGIG